jgi:hypothetical protein
MPGAESLARQRSGDRRQFAAKKKICPRSCPVFGEGRYLFHGRWSGIFPGESEAPKGLWRKK